MRKMDKEKSKRIDISRIKGLMFDVDGTLSDTDDHMVERLSRFLSPVSWLFRNDDPMRFARRMVMASETPANFIYGLADSLGLDAPVAKIYSTISQRRKKKNSKRVEFRMIDGVKEMLARFKGKFPMAVVSARDVETTRRFLETFDLIPYFDVVVTSQTCKHTKPYPDPVIFAAKQLDLPPENCVMIGDTIVDIRAGKSAGTQTIAVLCGFGTERELKRAGANLLLESTTLLPGIFSNQTGINSMESSSSGGDSTP